MGKPSYDEVLARNSCEEICETLRQCASMPCDEEYSYGIPEIVLPFALAVVAELKAKNPDCVILIFSTPGDGVTLKVHQRAGRDHYLFIEKDYIGDAECPEQSAPSPLFWRAALQGDSHG